MKTFYFILFLNLISILEINLFGHTIYVPDNYSSIQDAIESSNNGDTIIVKEGTYLENINLSGKNIVISSLFLLTNDTNYINTTIIDGNNNGSVITIINDEDESTVINGLSITNGNSESGGGILIDNKSKPNIYNCKIYNNTAKGGGGIAIGGRSRPQVKNCEIHSNQAIGKPGEGTSGGGAVKSGNYSSSKLINCKIYNNTSVCSGGGIKIYALITIERCVIYNNQAYDGGGISAWRGNYAKVINSTLYNNQAIEGPEIFIYDGNLIAINSIIYNDSINFKPSIIFVKPSCCTLWSNNRLLIDYSLVFGGINSINKVGEGAILIYTVNNIETDPFFIDRNNYNFHLQDSSPCIDNGISYLIIENDTINDEVIIMGDTIIVNPKYYNDSAPDMGAYENYKCDTAELKNIDVSICSGESYYINGDYQTEAGIYHDTIKTINGCDSIIIVANLKVETCTEISNISRLKQPIVFPNPTNSYVFIKNISLEKIEIFDFTGKIIQNYKTNLIDFSNYSEGIYFLRIYCKTGIYIDKILYKK